MRGCPARRTEVMTASGAGGCRGRDGQVVSEVPDTTGTGIAPEDDTATGIAREDPPSVFGWFWRADRSRIRRTGGSGPGLPSSTERSPPTAEPSR